MLLLTRIKICLLSLCLLLASAYAFGNQHSVVKDVNHYEQQTIKYRYQNPDSALYFANAGLKLARRNSDLDGEARMLTQLGMIDDNLGNFNDSREKYLRALAIYIRTNNSKGMVKLNIRLGVGENRNGRYDKAIRYFLSALNISTRTRDKAGQMESYVTLGEVYAHQKDFKKALSYYAKAEKISDSIPFFSITLNLYNDMGAAFKELRDFDNAKKYYEKGISLSNTPQMMGLHISLIIGLADVYSKLGDKTKCNELLVTALRKSKEINNFIRQILSLKGLADSYEKSYPKIALKYLDQALKLAKEKKAYNTVLELLDQISLIERNNRNYERAYRYKEEQYAIADSFYFKDISEKISNLQAINELSQSKARVQELRLMNSKQKLQKNMVFWGLIASVIVLLFLGYYFLRIRKYNRMLNRSNAALTESNEVKDKLFSVLAHDLRAPLASIINVLYLINEGMLTAEEQKDMMNRLAINCNASMETLNILLKWGHMQLKGVKLNRKVVAPFEIVDRNIKVLSVAAEQKNITVCNEIREDLSLYADADHLDFVVRNLLSNAIKFTYKQGKITISSTVLKSENQVLFKVSDNGVGIPDNRLQSVFSINSISTVGTNDEKGTSLGLVICKEFIEANEGKIWVESKAGEGSDFYFVLKHTA